MTLSCLPSDTAYDIRCPVCGRGFILMTGPLEASELAARRRTACSALAAQHRTPRKRTDRQTTGRDRRRGMPDTRAVPVERRGADRDRRAVLRDRRTDHAETLPSAHERRSASRTFRTGSGAVHPKTAFDLQGPDANFEPLAAPLGGIAVVQAPANG